VRLVELALLLFDSPFQLCKFLESLAELLRLLRGGGSALRFARLGNLCRNRVEFVGDLRFETLDPPSVPC
jgi:hypothetical protein